MPNRRRYAKKYYHNVGYVFPFEPKKMPARKEMKLKLGYGDRPLILCTIGGTAIGRQLLELCSRAYDNLKKEMPDLLMMLVCGPRLDPESVSVSKGVEVKGYLPDLYKHFAASDLVITHGGATTTLELTALRVPFIFFP